MNIEPLCPQLSVARGQLPVFPVDNPEQIIDIELLQNKLFQSDEQS